MFTGSQFYFSPSEIDIKELNMKTSAAVYPKLESAQQVARGYITLCKVKVFTETEPGVGRS